MCCMQLFYQSIGLDNDKKVFHPTQEPTSLFQKMFCLYRHSLWKENYVWRYTTQFTPLNKLEVGMLCWKFVMYLKLNWNCIGTNCCQYIHIYQLVTDCFDIFWTYVCLLVLQNTVTLVLNWHFDLPIINNWKKYWHRTHIKGDNGNCTVWHNNSRCK